MDLTFKGKYILKGTIHCVTGLHIGGSVAGIEIGGLDNPVIKDPLTEHPYIPGSALKGKLRSLLEWHMGLIRQQPEQQDKYTAYDCGELKKKKENSDDPDCWEKAFTLARLFGPASADEQVRQTAGPTRLTVRDAFPSPQTLDLWEERLGEGIFTEIKTENSLDRVTSEATPRPMERVPAGSEFEFEMILDVYRNNDHELFRDLFTAMHLLENSSLGGNGSRGHGQVKFQNLSLVWRSLEYYCVGEQEQAISLPGQDLRTIIKGFNNIESWPSAS